jgi:hypothetical protein
MKFVNIINGKYYKLIENIEIDWYEYSASHGGRNFIVEFDNVFYYGNSNVRNEFWETKLSTIEDIKLTIQNIESTSYRNAKIKEFELTNYRTIFDILLKHERQKKLDLIIS